MGQLRALDVNSQVGLLFVILFGLLLLASIVSGLWSVREGIDTLLDAPTPSIRFS